MLVDWALLAAIACLGVLMVLLSALLLALIITKGER